MDVESHATRRGRVSDEGGGTVRRGYRVRGRVQGVGFRWWTVRTAEELGLGGWVRNLRDGSVEVHACGPTDAMDRFGALLLKGPLVARVDGVEEVEADRAISPREGFRVEL